MSESHPALAQAVCPRWWRVTLVLLGTLILCACRSVPSADSVMPPGSSLPEMAYTGIDPAAAMVPPEGYCAEGYHPVGCGAEGCTPEDCEHCVEPTPLPCCVNGSCWRPPGIGGRWPATEYLCDGGDQGLEADVDLDFQVRGLEPEDTIAHYDTLDGRVIVKPSNCVCIYAPRFGAVRKVTAPVLDEQVDALYAVEADLPPARIDDTQAPSTALQHDLVHNDIGTKRLSEFDMNVQDGAVSRAQLPLSAQDAELPHAVTEDIRQMEYVGRQKAAVTAGIEAAIVWTADQAVQVIIDAEQALELVGDRRAQLTYSIEESGKPCLRILKSASECEAHPGDVIDFILRFDNVGDETIGNVTIVDHLVRRLEFVEGSAQSSLPAAFFPMEGEDETLVLRWEITDPLKPGQGGLVKFSCRVR